MAAEPTAFPPGSPGDGRRILGWDGAAQFGSAVTSAQKEFLGVYIHFSQSFYLHFIFSAFFVNLENKQVLTVLWFCDIQCVCVCVCVASFPLRLLEAEITFKSELRQHRTPPST